MSGSKRPVSTIESHLGYWLRYVSNQVSHAFALKVQARGVTVAEWVVMRQLHDADTRPSDIAGQLGMTRGAISKLADRLAAKGLVARTATDGDGRSHSLSLTDDGRALVPELAALADGNDDEFFGDLDPAVRDAIETAMKGIVRRRGLKAVPVE